MVRVRGTIDSARSESVLRGDPASGSMHLLRILEFQPPFYRIMGGLSTTLI
jgi:hypothetical protein